MCRAGENPARNIGVGADMTEKPEDNTATREFNWHGRPLATLTHEELLAAARKMAAAIIEIRRPAAGQNPPLGGQ
jgi:hypothetical protein